MSTLVGDRVRVPPVPAAPEPRRRPSLRTLLLAGAALVWILGFVILHGTSTLTLPASELTDLHRSLNQFNAWVAANRADNPVFLYVFTPLRAAVDAVANLFITTFAASSTGLRLPEIGWLGTVGLLGWIAFAIGNARVAVLTVAVFMFFGFQGLFVEAAEALVNEQRLDVDTAGFLLHHVREPEGQGERGHKGLAAGQR